MKKLIIGTVVAALILQVWQTLSWTALNVHSAEHQYTEHQDKIIAVLSEHLQEGEYMIPGMPPNVTAEDATARQEAAMGQPWATINYHPKFEMNMGMNMLRGFVVNLISGFFLCWILLKFRELNFSSALMTSIFVGLIGYLTIVYLNHVWFQGSTIGYLIDSIAAWGLVGAWLGFYLPEKAR